MELLLTGLMAKFPIIMTILLIMGTARAFIKPVVSMLHALVELTETEKDDLILKRAEESSIYKWTLFVLDWVVSLKLQKPVEKK